MNTENTALRLKRVMKAKGLKQVDLLNLLKPYCEKYNIKMNKSDISQYVADKVKPSQEKLVALGMALNVSEAWLMGLDVPVNKINTFNNLEVSQEEIILLENFNKLNDLGKNEANKRVSELTEINKYTIQERLEDLYTTIAAHDDDLTEDEKIEMNRRIFEVLKKK